MCKGEGMITAGLSKSSTIETLLKHLRNNFSGRTTEEFIEGRLASLTSVSRVSVGALNRGHKESNAVTLLTLERGG